MSVNKCATCFKTDDLNACSGCKITLYCSIECQRTDRADHKNMCDWAKDLAETKFTRVSCKKCKGPTLFTDYTCACLSKFCSTECREADGHVRGDPECHAIHTYMYSYVTRQLEVFMARRGNDFTDEENNDLGHALYLKALFMEFEADATERSKTLSRMLLMSAAKMMHKSAIARVGSFTNEQVAEALTIEL